MIRLDVVFYLSTRGQKVQTTKLAFFFTYLLLIIFKLNRSSKNNKVLLVIQLFTSVTKIKYYILHLTRKDKMMCSCGV